MKNPTNKIMKYRQGDAILIVGYDESGRLISRITKNDILLVSDLYMRMPSEVALLEQGWTKVHGNE